MEHRESFAPIMRLYQELLNSKDLRVLVVEPGEAEEAVHTRLEVENLSSCPPYEALSYYWDGQTPQFPIWCNSHKFLVTENVHSALWKGHGNCSRCFAD